MKVTAELGQRIRKYRKERKLTQEELSNKCKLHPTYIGQIERGEKNPSVESVYKICQALDIEITTLFEHLADFATDADEPTTAMQAYYLIQRLSQKDQERMLRIIEDILFLKKTTD